METENSCSIKLLSWRRSFSYKWIWLGVRLNCFRIRFFLRYLDTILIFCCKSDFCVRFTKLWFHLELQATLQRGRVSSSYVRRCFGVLIKGVFFILRSWSRCGPLYSKHLDFKWQKVIGENFWQQCNWATFLARRNFLNVTCKLKQLISFWIFRKMSHFWDIHKTKTTKMGINVIYRNGLFLMV